MPPTRRQPSLFQASPLGALGKTAELQSKVYEAIHVGKKQLRKPEETPARSDPAPASSCSMRPACGCAPMTNA